MEHEQCVPVLLRFLEFDPAEERKIVIRRLNGLYYFKNDPKAYVIYGDFKWTNLPN